MLKLIKNQEENILYAEIWQDGQEAIVHEGKVGDMGESYSIEFETELDYSVLLQDYMDNKTKDGFSQLQEEDMTTFSVCMSVESFGSEEDLTLRNRMEEILNEFLGWTGNGYCDGTDAGSGSMNIYCKVLDVEKALHGIKAALNDLGVSNKLTLGYEDDNDTYVVLFSTG